jgi:hypothetical protein
MAAVLWDDAAGCWRDGVLVQPAPPSGENAVGGGPAEGGAAGGSGGRPECGVCGVRLSSGVYASNYVPLWAGLAEGDEELGARVVASLEASGLVQPGGARCVYACGQAYARLLLRAMGRCRVMAVEQLPLVLPWCCIQVSVRGRPITDGMTNPPLAGMVIITRHLHFPLRHRAAVGRPKRVAAAAAHAGGGRARLRRPRGPPAGAAGRTGVGQVRLSRLPTAGDRLLRTCALRLLSGPGSPLLLPDLVLFFDHAPTTSNPTNVHV